MKPLVQFIQEKLIIKKNKTNNNYKYFPETNKELRKIIVKRIKDEGNEVDLNDIDTSNIKDMSDLFGGTYFNGDISKWNVSNVTNMGDMFFECKSFNKDISSWDVSNVKDMSGMFYKCESFNQDISNWDVSNVTNMSEMFYKCFKFKKDISNWDVSNVNDNDNMFYDCQIEENYKPKFK